MGKNDYRSTQRFTTQTRKKMPRHENPVAGQN